MCLAVPAKVIALDRDIFLADVMIMGNSKTVSIALVPEAEMGDWVLVHAGEAISIISPEAAQESERLWQDIING